MADRAWVLPVEVRTGAHAEVRLLAVHSPQHVAVGAVDLVQRPGVTGGNEQVAVRGLGDGVDVEVIERGGGGGARSISFVHPDVVEAVPIEQDLARRQVDLLAWPARTLPLREPPIEDRSVVVTW